MATILDEYLSKSELAKQLGKQPRTLDRWHTERRGPKRTKIGRSVFYRRTDLTCWLAKCAEEATA